MTNPNITFDHNVELLLESHVGEMSYELAEATIEQFGGTDKFEDIYERVFNIGIKSIPKTNLAQWETGLPQFYSNHKQEIDSYVKQVAEDHNYNSAIAMLNKDFDDIAHLSVDDIAEGWHNPESKNHEEIVRCLADYIGERVCRYCAKYMAQFDSEDEDAYMRGSH